MSVIQVNNVQLLDRLTQDGENMKILASATIEDVTGTLEMIPQLVFILKLFVRLFLVSMQNQKDFF